MPQDLPIYSNSVLRTGLQFADLLKYQAVDTTPVWDKSDGYIAQMEGAGDVGKARATAVEPTKDALIHAHATLFSGKEGAGRLRQSTLAARYRGQDCPEPEFIDRSLDNFLMWMTAESFAEIHPIEKAALVLTRLVDIWPFDVGNLTMAVFFANIFLRQAGLAPFFVTPEQMKEFEEAVARAVTIETQPLVNAIHVTIRREMEALAR